ncbi:MAG: hypothetical protein JW726_06295 [Anaerolineales bacterium]|nr:hypothetical protein [Anaerolineales bacterium]
MNPNFDIIDVNPSNLKQRGFFCYMSKPKTPGYLQKRDWLEKRFAEGLKLKILHEHGGRDTAFIEYIPGEYAWRAMHAPGYIFIHCLWVVGKGKGKGYGKQLLQACLDDAHAQGKQGVAIVTTDATWLPKKKFFLANGFVEVDQAPPCFQMLVYRFDDSPAPSFPRDWESRLAAFGPGLTVVRTPQCPYIENAVVSTLKLAAEKGIPARQVELTTAREVQTTAPCAYGVFGIVLDGKLLSYIYLARDDFGKRLMALRDET